jgi:hypothetical protein
MKKEIVINKAWHNRLIVILDELSKLDLDDKTAGYVYSLD